MLFSRVIYEHKQFRDIDVDKHTNRTIYAATLIYRTNIEPTENKKSSKISKNIMLFFLTFVLILIVVYDV